MPRINYRVKDQRPDECVLCDSAAADVLIIGTATTNYANVPMCHAHLAAMRLQQWWLTVRLLEVMATISGELLVDSFAREDE